MELAYLDEMQTAFANRSELRTLVRPVYTVERNLYLGFKFGIFALHILDEDIEYRFVSPSAFIRMRLETLLESLLDLQMRSIELFHIFNFLKFIFTTSLFSRKFFPTFQGA